MAEEKSELDQSEPATPFKLEKAHKRGSVIRSGELTFAFVMLACVAAVYGLGTQVMNALGVLLGRGLSFTAREELSSPVVLAYIKALGGHAATAIAPLVFVVWLAALLTAALQARGVFTTHPLKPDFSRLNPAAGFKRIVSIKSLHELWRNTAKLAVISVAMVIWGHDHVGTILRITRLSPRAMVYEGIALLGSALALLAGVVFVFALLEWSLNRWDFLKKMRMSKREIKEEHKEREGDPRIKARLRELRLSWLKRARQLSKVRSADVLLTNPTHYAVALEYRHGEMPAPMITARGAGEMARRMRAEARRRAVPVVEHPSLARALFRVQESQSFVPEEHFEQVARVLRWVYAARDSHRNVGHASP